MGSSYVAKVAGGSGRRAGSGRVNDDSKMMKEERDVRRLDGGGGGVGGCV